MDIKTLQSDFTLIETLTHNNPVPFFKKYLNIITPWSILYFFLTFLIFVIFFYTITSDYFNFTFLLAIPFVLIIILPIHELIHAFFYKIYGAKNISFKVEIKKLVVYTMSNKDVVSFKVLNIIAVAPAIILTFILAIFSMIFYNSVWGGFFAFTSLLHISL